MSIGDQLEALESTAGGFFPPEILFERNKLWRELTDKIKEIPVEFEEVC